MRHHATKFPNWKNASRDTIAAVFAPFSGYCFLSLAKLYRSEDRVIGNGGPIVCSRNRRKIGPKASGGGTPRRLGHGKDCGHCNPRQGRPRKPYNRAAAKRAATE